MNSKPDSPPKRRGRRRRPRRRNNKPLKASFAERLGPLMPQLAPSEPTPRSRALPAPPPKSARAILGLLMASTGLALAARRVHVELLPGTPTTVVVCERGRARAAFVLPISEGEARKAFGRPVPQPRDRLVEQLFEEDRQDALTTPDVLLDQRRAFAWAVEDRYAS